MAKDEVTTIQIDVETRDKLKALGVAFERTAAGQLRWLVNQEYDKLAVVKLVPQVDESTFVKEQGQGMVEFVVLLALVAGVLLAFGLLVAVIVIFVVVVLGPIAGRVFQLKTTHISNPSPKSEERI